jgi:hypothetical protein
MRWVCASKQGIFAGGMGRTSPGFGIWNDGMIFKDALVSMLEYGERCETDGGYRGSAPEFVKCPLVTPYRHDFNLHQTVFAAVIVLLQLSFEYNPLFSVEYND